jgi:ABC-2 type transport system permease protein
MSNILNVAKREFKSIVLTKWYIASIVLVPLVVFVTIVLAFSLQFINIASKPVLSTVIADETGELSAFLVKNSLLLSQKLNLEIYSRKPILKSQNEKLQSLNVQTYEWKLYNPQVISDKIKNEKLEGSLNIPADFFEKSEVKYFARNNLMGALPDKLKQMLEGFRLNQLSASTNLSQAQLQKILSPIKAETFSLVAVNKKDKGKDSNSMRLLAAVVIYGILSICIAIHGSKLTMSILEEKRTKIMEILLSAVTPVDFMWGKILGSASAAFIQTGIWSVLLFFAFVLSGSAVFETTARAMIKNSQAPSSISVTAGSEIIKSTINENASFKALEQPQITINPEMLIYLIVFTVAGFLLYATLFAAVGAIANSATEAQYLETPLVFLMMFPTYLFLPLIENPNGPVIVLSSFFPYFSPFVMYSRICVDQVPFSQIILSLGLLVAAIGLNVLLVSALYRAGVLLYGKKLTIAELWNVVNLSVQKVYLIKPKT